MSFRLDRVHVWSCEVPDKPGGVAAKLSVLAQAGANLQYVGTRRQPDKPGTGVLYVAPLSGADQLKAAREAGMHEVQNPVLMRVTGDNKAGLAHRLTQQWALAGISFQGLTMTVLGEQFIGYAAFDSPEDANKAARILAEQAVA
jgi:predicted amino acid-binding ACT domain protein